VVGRWCASSQSGCQSQARHRRSHRSVLQLQPLCGMLQWLQLNGWCEMLLAYWCCTAQGSLRRAWHVQADCQPTSASAVAGDASHQGLLLPHPTNTLPILLPSAGFCSSHSIRQLPAPHNRPTSLVCTSCCTPHTNLTYCRTRAGAYLTNTLPLWLPSAAFLQPLHPPVACTTEEANIPGLYLLHDFISEQEEQQLLAAIDKQPWLQLSKRRVQHYGYRFEYTTRGVDLKEKAGEIPDWQQQVVQRVQVRAPEQNWDGGRCSSCFLQACRVLQMLVGRQASGMWSSAATCRLHMAGIMHGQVAPVLFVKSKGCDQAWAHSLTPYCVPCCAVLCFVGASRCSCHRPGDSQRVHTRCWHRPTCRRPLLFHRFRLVPVLTWQLLHGVPEGICGNWAWGLSCHKQQGR
jgi:hypothetical protein